MLAALVVAFLNDMTKPKEARKKPEKHAPGSVLGLVIGIAVVVGGYALSVAYGRDVPGLAWLLPLVWVCSVLLVLVFLLRKVIWLYLKSALTGRLPRVIRRNADGESTTKCPSCSTVVSVTQGQVGEIAFECSVCGEKATWASQTK